jgi:tRNA A-37 threonylcarbamoyl transferase component Bud32
MSLETDDEKTHFMKKHDILNLFEKLKTNFLRDELKRISHTTSDGKKIDYFVTDYDRLARYDRYELIRIMDTDNQESEISIIRIKTESQNYNVYKFNSRGEIAYYAVNKNMCVGSGSDGDVYAGFNILTGEPLVAKYGYIGVYEEEFLKKTGLYIASEINLIPSTVLMHRAPGTNYDNILRDSSISDNKKIEIHEKIIEKILDLRNIHNISHNDIALRHIFVDLNNNDQITMIDFGMSTPVTIVDEYEDMTEILRLQTKTLEIYDSYYESAFKDYINHTIKRIKRNQTIIRRIKKIQEGDKKVREENINKFIGFCLVITSIGALVFLVKNTSNESLFQQ